MSNTKILIADDNEQFSKAMQNYLRKLMVEDIILARDGEIALEYIECYRPNIVLLDLKMQKLNGIEVLRDIQRFKDLSIIIISSESKFINQIPCTNYEMIKGVFHKPVDLQNIYYSVKYILAQQKHEKESINLNHILDEFEFNKSSRGYNFLVECLEEIFENPEELINIEKTAYKNIADKHNLNEINQVKWCISKSIKSMIRYTDTKILLKYFRDINRITPKNFIIEMYSIIKNGKL